MQKSRALSLTVVAALSIVVAACNAAATPAPATPAPTAVPPVATPAPASPAASGATVEAKPVGSIGTVLVAGSNGMTVYIFTKDVANSGTSACTGGCLDTWPPLTVPAGSAPVAGDGVTGQLGTITRADDGSLQVTYKGLPLYFFASDKAPGDANGVYTNWEAVKP